MTVCRRAALAAALASIVAGPAAAQSLPSGPIVFADGHVTVAGDAAVSFAPQDPGFFNYTDYEHSALRMVRLDVSGAVKAGEHLSILGDVRNEDAFQSGVQFDRPRTYALYARIRPWTDRAFDIQVGRIPPTFGSFARRTYASDNLLIGYPLAYQYLTSLRPDAIPANADELLRMRGRGWLSNYSVGDPSFFHGVPLVSAFTWDTGVQVHAATGMLDVAGAVTTGTLANPLFHDDNDGRQFAGRVSMTPTAGLIIGGSVASGPFLSTSALRSALQDGNDGQFRQTALGVDAEYSRDYYLVRVETIVSDWTLPIVRAPTLSTPLRAISTSVEGRYKLRPGLYAAARLDHLGFSQITGSSRTDTWDAPVTRVEVGGGYSLQRNLLLKLSYQYNTRVGGRVQQLSLPAVQLLFWF